MFLLLKTSYKINMTEKQIELLEKRLIFESQKYCGMEPDYIRKENDLNFCLDFFGKNEVDYSIVHTLLINSIKNKKEMEFDLLLMLLEHFNITKDFDLILSELLIQPWHHFHDRIANILNFDRNNDTIDYLYKGALYSCENLAYQSDYCEFNRKCLYALAKIGTTEAINYIEKIAICDNLLVSQYANNILKEFGYQKHMR